MTVNVGLVTAEALVLGCDSVASTSGYFLDPIALPWTVGADGKPIRDADGKFSLKFNYQDYQSVVTNAWGGVTKMFEIHPSPSPVVAVTAGLAKLNDRPMASYADEFLSLCSRRATKLVKIETISRQFLQFMRRKYDAHYKGSQWPTQFRDGLTPHPCSPCVSRVRLPWSPFSPSRRLLPARNRQFRAKSRSRLHILSIPQRLASSTTSSS